MRTKQGARAGVASLELVMSFPILVVLVAMLFTMGITIKKRSQVTMDVRHQAWAERTAPIAPNPFAITTAHSAGQAKVVKQDKVTMYKDLFPFIPRDIKWGNVVLTGSWDYRQVEFSEAGWIPIYPHFGVLTKMASAQGGVNANSGSIGALSKLVNIPH